MPETVGVQEKVNGVGGVESVPTDTPFTKNSTPVTVPMPDVADAVRVVVPVIEAPAAGAVIETTGGGSVTVTLTADVVVCRPRLSVARAVMVAVPDAVGDQEIE